MSDLSHPSKEIIGTEGHELAGRKIVLCITGSVAAYRAIDLARLLMRHGAEVYAVMTEATSSQLLSSEMMRWATGNGVVTRLTGELEHIRLADFNTSDLVLVYPCTANTIGKMAAGIDDTPVTSVLSVALGSKVPIIIAPAMHEAMYDNPIIASNLEKLSRHVIFVEPNVAEGKAKVAEPDQILQAVIRKLSAGPLAGKSVLITTGSTIEYIDPIRVVTNLSTGKMGVALAGEARKLGAQVTIIYGHGTADPANLDCKLIRVGTSREMLEAVRAELSSNRYDMAIMAAAVADFAPATTSQKKINSRAGKVNMELVKTEKIVDQIKRISKDTILVAFKADHNVSEGTLKDRAIQKLQESRADFVVANDVGRVSSAAGSDKNEVYVIDSRKNVIHLSLDDKNVIARKILEIVVRTAIKK
jgi:phosphopantothenoylcysteine decarboxylase/phosphopantothenate--cysteine ligase